MSSKKISQALSWAFFAIGLALLFFLVRREGAENIWHNMHDLGWGLGVVLGLPVSWLVLQGMAWRRILVDDGFAIDLRHIIVTKIIGEAVNTLTPVGFIGGDPYRIYLLKKKLGGTASTASVVVDRTFYALATLVLIAGGLVAAQLMLPLPQHWKILFPCFTLAFLAGMVALIHYQKQGIFTRLAGLLKRLHIQRQRLERLADQITMLDDQISSFYRKHPAHFFGILTYQVAGRLLGVMEIWLIAHLMSLPVTLPQSLFLASITVLINMAFFFVPSSMGVLEGGYAVVFQLIGGDPTHGLSIQIIRRVRTIVWTLLGLLLIILYHPKTSKVGLSERAS